MATDKHVQLRQCVALTKVEHSIDIVLGPVVVGLRGGNLSGVTTKMDQLAVESDQCPPLLLAFVE